jgi:hypothetical protein
MWRKKSLQLAEWSRLQNSFAELQLSLGAPSDLAMFIRSEAGSPLSDIFITGPGIEVIELQSPGGWEDSAAPSGDGVVLLVAEGNPWAYFGIEQPTVG